MYFDSKNTSRKLQLLHSECMSKTRDFPLKKPPRTENSQIHNMHIESVGSTFHHKNMDPYS